MASLRCVNAPSSARLFVQLAKRSVGGAQASRNPATLPVLDIFVPGWKAEGSGRSSFTTKRQSHTLPSTLPRKTASNIVQTRSFTASAVRRATTCVCNPQQDEDGNGMNIEITDRAGKRLTQIMQKDSNPHLALRVIVESGGCHGFQYLMKLITLPASGPGSEEWSSVVAEDDSLFQYAIENSEAAAASDTAAAAAPADGSPKVVIDQASLDLLKGSKVDFTSELIGSQFKVVDMPLAGTACGCGTSFDIKL